MQIGSVTIGTQPPRPVSKTPTIDVQTSFPADVVKLPPDLRIRTNAAFWCHVVTDSLQDAMTSVRGRELVILRHALSRGIGRVVDVEVTWAYPAAGGPGAGSASSVASAMGVAPAPLRDPELIGDDYQAVDADARCLDACRILNRARELRDAQSYLGPPAGYAAVLEYAKALEYLATDSRLRQRLENRAEKQEELLSDLTSKLGRARNTKQRVAAVMTSADQMKRLDNKFLDQRVTAMAAVLSLSGEWLKVARQLISARNNTAAHPGGAFHEMGPGAVLAESSADWMIGEAIAAVAAFDLPPG